MRCAEKWCGAQFIECDVRKMVWLEVLMSANDVKMVLFAVFMSAMLVLL